MTVLCTVSTYTFPHGLIILKSVYLQTISGTPSSGVGGLVHKSVPNIPSTIPSTCYSAMNHPTLDTPVQPFPASSSIKLKTHPLTDNLQQLASQSKSISWRKKLTKCRAVRVLQSLTQSKSSVIQPQQINSINFLLIVLTDQRISFVQSAHKSKTAMAIGVRNVGKEVQLYFITAD